MVLNSLFELKFEETKFFDCTRDQYTPTTTECIVQFADDLTIPLSIHSCKKDAG